MIVEPVSARARPPGVDGDPAYSLGILGTGSSVGMGGSEPFLELPNENVLPAFLRKPPWLRLEARPSSAGMPLSVDDGAVDALLCREELSDAVLVLLEPPLPLVRI